MSLEIPNASRLADSFHLIDAVRFDRTGGYKMIHVPGLNMPEQPGPQKQLSPGAELEIKCSVPDGEVGVATFEPMNWPGLCKAYMAWFLGDIFSFGRALTYREPEIDPREAANRKLVFTLQQNGKLRCASMGMEHIYDLYKCGATEFYVTLRRKQVFLQRMTVEEKTVRKKNTRSTVKKKG